MSYGRKDYFWGIAPEKSVFGELQTSFNEDATNTITSGSTVQLITSTVSTGYNLELTGVYLGSSLPGTHIAYIKVDTVVKATIYFDTSIMVNMTEGGSLKIIGGQVLTVEAKNLDSVTGTFSVVLYGFKQQTIV